MTKTKTVATIGPASQARQTLERLVEVGMDVVRFNMSHGEREEHQSTLDTLRDIVGFRGTQVATLVDLGGPKVRCGLIDPAQAMLASGAMCAIVRSNGQGTAERFSTNYSALVEDVQTGQRVLIDDGNIRLRVTEKRADALICICETGGPLGSHKGINLPDSHLSLPALTEKDHVDLKWAVANSADYVAQSFVRGPGDVQALRKTLHHLQSDIPIIAKLETPQAIETLDAIIAEADALLVARGDLGVEMDVWRVPMLQKDIVKRCRRVGKPVIIATQMLQSMVHQPTPTRAEVSDVANAVLDGADALMLSAESAVGTYPVEAVAMLNRIVQQVEEDPTESAARWLATLDDSRWVGHDVDRTTAAVARSAAIVAHDLGANLIVVWCRTGRTARWISKYQMPQVLVSLSSDEALCRRMALCHGVEPMQVSAEFENGTEPSPVLYDRIVRAHGLEPGAIVVIVGEPTAPHRASTVSIHVVGSARAEGSRVLSLG